MVVRSQGFGREADDDESGIDDVDRRIDVAFASGGDGVLKDAYDRYSSLVFSFCRRSLAADLASDATQDTFVSAWRSRSSYDESKGSVAGWLVGIARFKVIEQLRRAGRDSGGVAVAGQHPRQHDPDELDRVADRMLVAEALDQLPTRVRSVVEMAFLEDLTHAEIAERCSLPLGTVKSDVRRGVERMRRHLESRSGVNHGS